MRSGSRSKAPAVFGLGAVIIAAAALGTMSAYATELALSFAVVILVVGLSFVDARVLPVLAAPGTLLVSRVAGEVASGADVILAAATAVALFLVRDQLSRTMLPLLWAGGAYLALTVPTLILNPFAANFVEWGHELVLVLGSMVVGYAVGRFGAAKAALWSYVVACAVLAVRAVVVFVVEYMNSGEIIEVYLPPWHKNYLGGAFAVAIVIAFTNPRWLSRSPVVPPALGIVCALGLFATQSRQGIVAAIVGIVFVVFRSRAVGGAWKTLIGLAVVPLLLWVANTVGEQLTSDNIHNSAFERLSWYDASVDIWRESPLFGVGMRWWYTDQYGLAFQPPNAQLEVLTTTGVVGLIGFTIMIVGGIWALTRVDPVYGTLGIAIILTRLTQAQFDLYWVAGQAALLWIVAGICIGAAERHDAGEDTFGPHTVTEERLDRTLRPPGDALSSGLDGLATVAGVAVRDTRPDSKRE